MYFSDRVSCLACLNFCAGSQECDVSVLTLCAEKSFYGEIPHVCGQYGASVLCARDSYMDLPGFYSWWYYGCGNLLGF